VEEGTSEMSESVCIGNHQNHMCMLMTNPLMDNTEFEGIKELARGAEFICKNCGRSAKHEENLCNPLPL
jgi:hypothetical protein